MRTSVASAARSPASGQSLFTSACTSLECTLLDMIIVDEMTSMTMTTGSLVVAAHRLRLQDGIKASQ